MKLHKHYDHLQGTASGAPIIWGQMGGKPRKALLGHLTKTFKFPLHVDPICPPLLLSSINR